MNILTPQSSDIISDTNNVLARYHKRHKPYLDPSSIACKRNAIWLGLSVEGRVPGVEVALGKVSRVNQEAPLIHRVGGDYNHHYVVMISSENTGIHVLDPLLFVQIEGAIPVDQYLACAFETPDNGRLERVGPVPRK